MTTIYYETFETKEEVFNGPVTEIGDTSVYGRIGRNDAAYQQFHVPDTDADVLEITFDFYQIDSWDNEKLIVDINGQAVDLGQYYVYGDANPRFGFSGDVNWTVTPVETTQMGFGHWIDKLWQVSLYLPPSMADEDGNINMVFSTNLNSSINDESLAIDNVRAKLLDPTRTLIAESTFEGSHSEWSNTNTLTLDNGDKAHELLLPYDVASVFYSVPEHQAVFDFEFDLYVVDTNYSEEIYVDVNGHLINLGEFQSNVYEGHRSGTLADINYAITNMGHSDMVGSSAKDQKYRVSLTIPAEYAVGQAMNIHVVAFAPSGEADLKYTIDNAQLYGIAATKVVVAIDDFEDHTPSGWGNSTTSYDNNLGSFLGRFHANDQQNVEKTFKLPGGTESITVEFDFLEIDSWDWEQFIVRVDGTDVALGTFRHAENEGSRSGNMNGVAWTTEVYDEYATPVSLGFSHWQDQIHKVTMEIPVSLLKSRDEVTLAFDSTLGSSLGDESWGIDNLKITASVDTSGPDGRFDQLARNIDFEDDYSSGHEWGASTASHNSFTTQYLGQIGRDQVASVGAVFSDYNLNQGVKIEFDFLEIDSWDDEDLLLSINNIVINLGSFNHKKQELESSGVVDGITWTQTQTTHGSFMYKDKFQDGIHAIELVVPQNILDGNYLTLGFANTLDGGYRNENMGIDNIKVHIDSSRIDAPDMTSGSSSPVDAALAEFKQGHVHRGDVLDITDQSLGRGDALVSEDRSTVFYISRSGEAWMLHDGDKDGTYEWSEKYFDLLEIDTVHFTSAGSAIIAYGPGGTQVIYSDNSDGEHSITALKVTNDGTLISFETDGSIAHILDTNGARKLKQGDHKSKVAVFDNFVAGVEGWTKSNSIDDADWLEGERIVATYDSSDKVIKTENLYSVLNKEVALDYLNYRHQEKKPVTFTFEIEKENASDVLDVKLGFADTTHLNQSLTLDLGDIDSFGSKQFTVNQVTHPNLFGPKGNIGLEEGDVKVEVTQNGNSYVIEATFDNVNVVPRKGGAELFNTNTNHLGEILKIPGSTWVQLDAGSGNIIKMKEFSVDQYQDATSNNTPNVTEFKQDIKNFEIDSINVSSLANANVMHAMKSTINAVHHMDDFLQTSNFSEWNYTLADWESVVSATATTINKLKNSASESALQSSSLADVARLGWSQFSEIKAADDAAKKAMAQNVFFLAVFAGTSVTSTIAARAAYVEIQTVNEAAKKALALEQELKLAETELTMIGDMQDHNFKHDVADFLRNTGNYEQAVGKVAGLTEDVEEIAGSTSWWKQGGAMEKLAAAGTPASVIGTMSNQIASGYFAGLEDSETLREVLENVPQQTLAKTLGGLVDMLSYVAKEKYELAIETNTDINQAIELKAQTDAMNDQFEKFLDVYDNFETSMSISSWFTTEQMGITETKIIDGKERQINPFGMNHTPKSIENWLKASGLDVEVVDYYDSIDGHEWTFTVKDNPGAGVDLLGINEFSFVAETGQSSSNGTIDFYHSFEADLV